MSEVLHLKLAKLEPACDPNVVLEKAKDVYESVFVIGWDNNGELDARASLNLNDREINWLLDIFKTNLLLGKYSK